MDADNRNRDDPDVRFLKALGHIQSIFDDEVIYWLKSDRSKTSDRIQSYDTYIRLIASFYKKRKIASVMFAMRDGGITINNLERCIYHSVAGAFGKRQCLRRHFYIVCNRLLGATIIIIHLFTDLTLGDIVLFFHCYRAFERVY